MYYQINFLYSEDRHGIFEHLPVAIGTTTDLSEVRKAYDNTVKYQSNKYGNSLVYSKETELDYNCRIAESMFHCTEPAYKPGYYIIELSAYHHNPFNI